MRKEAGKQFNSIPTEQGIKGTRHNMMSQNILNFDSYPEINITSIRITRNSYSYIALLRFAVSGQLNDLEMPAKVELIDNKLVITGNTIVRQTELGIKPFSILMGAIAVRNSIDIRFRLIAKFVETLGKDVTHKK